MAERWRPQSLADLQSFIGNGHGEDHYREFKEQLQPRNDRLARQLAGFAVDGGDIYYGVAESGTGFEIVPLELAGLPERVEQIAQARVSPPVLIEVQALRDDTRQARDDLDGAHAYSHDSIYCYNSSTQSYRSIVRLSGRPT